MTLDQEDQAREPTADMPCLEDSQMLNMCINSKKHIGRKNTKLLFCLHIELNEFLTNIEMEEMKCKP